MPHGIDAALVQTYGEDGCQDGWAVRVQLDSTFYASEGIGGSGPFRMQDNPGGFATMGVPAIDATPVEILEAGAVQQYIRIDALVTNGTVRTFLAFSMQFGGVLSQNMITGSETYQFRLNVNGSVDVRRTAGALTGSTMVRMMWI